MVVVVESATPSESENNVLLTPAKQASIFYLDNNDEIVNALLKCDTNTGHWGNTGEYVISGGSPKVAPNTGLSAVLLGATDGYRVYYNGLDGTLHQIGYTSSTTWKYYGVVSNDKMSAQAIGSTFSNGNITVIRSRDSKNMGVSRLYSDHSWHLCEFDIFDPPLEHLLMPST